MYKALGYQVHHTSPSVADPAGHLEDPTGYEILSLCMDPAPQAERKQLRVQQA